LIPRYLIDVDFKQTPREQADVIVIGAGIAGLFTAIRAAETKKSVNDYQEIIVGK
jgi:L-aspartate oxidase